MKNYDTLVEALNDLKTRGFTFDFNIERNIIHCAVLNKDFVVDDFEITEFYRFDDNSDVADENILYAIETQDGHKGVLLDAYGSESGGISDELLKKFTFKKR